LGLIGFAWALVIVLKVAGLAFLTTSWWVIIFWPIIPIVLIFILIMVGALGASVLSVGRYRR